MTDNEVFERNLLPFKIEKRYQSKEQCKCPAHDDKHASLTITKGRKCTLFYCHAGCGVDDVLMAAGIKKKDTFYDAGQISPSWKAYVESREKKKIEAVYNYVSLNGNYAFSKIRLEGKKMLYGILENERFTYGLRGKARKELSAVYAPNGVQGINKAIAEGRPVFIPEGEKDVDTLARQGYASFSCGGVNDWAADMAQLCNGAVVYVLADNDEPGKRVANAICNDLQGIAKSAKVIVPVPDVPKADISDYFQAGHSKQEFEQMLQQERNTVKESAMDTVEHATSIMPQGQQSKALEQVLKDIHAEQYETTDKGFGRLYADVFKDMHRYNPSRKDFMLYDGKRWVDDTEGLNARTSAKALSDALIRYAISIDTEGKYLKAVTSLCNIRNRNNMLQDSKDVYFFDNAQLDTDDFILNVQNGTLDLSGDEPVFMNHTPDMLLSKMCNVEYAPAADCKEWEKFLMEIMQGDNEKMMYLQKIAGLSLTGITKEETCFILYGSTTRNGKGTFCETLVYLLGDYAITIKPESLAVRQNLDSRQASGDIARLAGCRLCNASEPQKRMIFDTALLKTLLGRDSITARHLYQREFSFIPKFKLVINTNYLPTVTDDTVFSSGRINVVSFGKHFSTQEQDKDLKNRLQDKCELSGILNWCIEGLRLYRKEGLHPPAVVQAATNAYRADSDKVGNFISECLTKTGKNSKARDVYEVYAKWCEDNGYGTENKGNFFAELKTKGLFMNRGTVDGMTVKNVVKGYTIETDFVDFEGQETLPFD